VRKRSKQTREEHLARSLSRQRPWEAEGISRSTWELRRRKAAEATEAAKRKTPHSMYWGLGTVIESDDEWQQQRFIDGRVVDRRGRQGGGAAPKERKAPGGQPILLSSYVIRRRWTDGMRRRLALNTADEAAAGRRMRMLCKADIDAGLLKPDATTALIYANGGAKTVAQYGGKRTGAGRRSKWRDGNLISVIKSALEAIGSPDTPKAVRSVIRDIRLRDPKFYPDVKEQTLGRTYFKFRHLLALPAMPARHVGSA
jgi:hypothetical protein